MIETDERRIKEIRNNDQNSIILRRGGVGDKLRIRICGRKKYDHGDFAWLKKDRKINPVWVHRHRCWETPKAWFNRHVREFIDTDGKLFIVQPYREQEKCSPACQNAIGHECQCSCMGEFHGAANIESGWFVVSDTFATRWGERKLACRLIEAS